MSREQDKADWEGSPLGSKLSGSGKTPAWTEEEPHKRKLGDTEVTCVTILPWLCSVPVAAGDWPGEQNPDRRHRLIHR